jgi:phosphoglycolate phosphatase
MNIRPFFPALFVFDLDGTLIDSRRDLADSANDVVVSWGGRRLPVEAVTRMVGEGARLLVARAFEAAGLGPAPESALDEFLATYDRRLFDHTRPYEGAEEMLAWAATEGRVAILTNKPQAPAERLCEHFGFSRHATRIVGGDSQWPRKPAPESLLALAAAAGAAPDATLMVGDSRIDFETARNAGTHICLARYGFGWEQFPVDRLRGDEVLIDEPRDLAPALGAVLRVE